MARRLAFLGTPDAAATCLRALITSGHDIVVVVTQPDRRRSRGTALVRSPVAAVADEHAIPVIYDANELVDLELDLGIVVAYGQIIKSAVLDRITMLNVHFSLLPRWRGAAPVERAILAGDEETGVCIMGLERTLDTGPIYATARTPVAHKTASALTAELAKLGAELLEEVLSHEQLPEPVAQEGEATYAAKLNNDEFVLDASMDVDEVERRVRCERALITLRGRRLKILSVEPVDEPIAPGSIQPTHGRVLLGCRNGSLALGEVKAEGARAMSAQSWWAGARLDAPVMWGHTGNEP